jgi:hypothetical protein
MKKLATALLIAAITPSCANRPDSSQAASGTVPPSTVRDINDDSVLLVKVSRLDKRVSIDDVGAFEFEAERPYLHGNDFGEGEPAIPSIGTCAVLEVTVAQKASLGDVGVSFYLDYRYKTLEPTTQGPRLIDNGYKGFFGPDTNEPAAAGTARLKSGEPVQLSKYLAVVDCEGSDNLPFIIKPFATTSRDDVHSIRHWERHANFELSPSKDFQLDRTADLLQAQ